MFALQCVALGKPVCACIQGDLEYFMSFVLAAYTSSGNISENIVSLLEDELRERI
jgi:SNF family Na+-dependent transporter